MKWREERKPLLARHSEVFDRFIREQAETMTALDAHLVMCQHWGMTRSVCVVTGETDAFCCICGRAVKDA